jgi:pantetheine-phosphate adenylyltransferase
MSLEKAKKINKEYSDLPWTEVEKYYSEKHRYFHTLEHLEYLFTKIEKYLELISSNQEDKLEIQDILYLTTIYHDIVYDPTQKDNEKKSAELWMNFVKPGTYQEVKVYVNQMIKDTENHEYSEGLENYYSISYAKLSQVFIDADLSGLRTINFTRLLATEEQIFKEYQFVNWDVYKENRIKFLKEYVRLDNDINKVINYVSAKKPRIGVYAGSFNPFHRGHLNILEKAEEIFDKVIIVKAVNPKKKFNEEHYNQEYEVLNSTLKFREVVAYRGLITDFIQEQENNNSDVTLLRGLRNGYDLDAENKYTFYLKKIHPKIKIAYIPCDKEYEYFNSTSIREMKKLNKDITEFLP